MAAALRETGDEARARELLGHLEHFLDARHRLGFEGYTISRAEVLVLQGRPEAAIQELEELFDQGWMQLYGTPTDSWYGQISPILARLSGNQDFDRLSLLAESNLAQMRKRIEKG